MSVNIEKINEVIESVRNTDPAKFDMRDDSTCILNHIDSGVPGKYMTIEKATAKLGLSYDEGKGLFIYISSTSKNRVDIYNATNMDAVRVLEHLRDTGIVDWSVARPE
jgi:hypothetical protein